jgi:nucleoside-diphosphate-sugar epimerase
VAGTEVFTFWEISDQIGRMLGKTPVYRFVTDFSRQDIIGDIGAMKALLGFEPVVRLATGLEEML